MRKQNRKNGFIFKLCTEGMVKETEAQAKIEIDQQKQIKISYFYI